MLSRPAICRKGIALLICLPLAAFATARFAGAETPPAQASAGAGTQTEDVLSTQTGTVLPQQEQQSSSGSPSSDIPEDVNQQTLVDAVHARLSREIQETATWMDSFFGDRRYESELNESYVRLRQDVFKEEGTDVSIRKTEARVRIVLPQLQRKTRIFFSGRPKDGTDFSTIGFVPEDPEDREVDKLSAGVQQTIIDNLKNNLSIRVGVRVSDGEPVLVFGPRYRILFPQDSWQFRFIEEANWIGQAGWNSVTTLDAEWKLDHNLFFRASNTWRWVEDTSGVVYDVSFGIRQPIDAGRALGYEWINLFRTRPIHELTETILRVRYRQQMFGREWAFFEVSPQYRFPRTNSFHGLAGILFRLEVILGDYR